MSQSHNLPKGQDWFIERMNQVGHNMNVAVGVCNGRAIYETLLMFNNNVDTLDTDAVNNSLKAIAEIPKEEVEQKVKEWTWKRNKLALDAKEAAFKELPPDLQKKALTRSLSKEEQKQYVAGIQNNWQKILANLDPKERTQLNIPAHFKGVALCQSAGSHAELNSLLFPDHVIKGKLPAAQEVSNDLLEIVQPNLLGRQNGVSSIDKFVGVYTESELTNYLRGLSTQINKNPENAHPVSLLLNNTLHAIAIGYDPSKKSWIFNDPNVPGVDTLSDENMLAKKINTAFFSQDKPTAFSTEILVANKHKEQMQQHITSWHNQEAMKEMHKVIPERAEMKAGKDVSLAHVSAFTGDAKTIKEIATVGGSLGDPLRIENAIIIPISMAAQNGKLDAVEAIFSKETSNAPQAMYVAAQHGHNDVVNYLLKNNVNPNDISDMTSIYGSGKTPLIAAASKGFNNVVESLLKHKADPNKADNNGMTALHAAADKGFNNVVESLLKHKADPNKADNNGITALHLAADRGHQETMTSLLKAPEIDGNKVDKYGQTPLMMAACQGHKNSVETLFTKGKKIAVDLANAYGVTPLYAATVQGHEPIVKLLLDKGANPNLANEMGLTPLHRAAEKGFSKIINTLLDCKKTNPIKLNNEGKTPVQVASDNGQKNAVSALLEHRTNASTIRPFIDDNAVKSAQKTESDSSTPRMRKF